MSPEIERWRQYLRRDPTRFMLDEEANPSVFCWYLIDVAHRPEDSSAVLAARERVLYSTPVQEILTAQQPEGYWEQPDSLNRPRYRATLWNLALLAELCLPRDSRRARAACEFVLQNYLDERGHFTSLDGVETGILLRALAYFNLAADARVQRAARALAAHAATDAVSDEVRVAALWALRDLDAAELCAPLVHRLGESLPQRTEFGPITFPSFDPSDPLFILRAVSDTPLLGDPRLVPLIDRVIQKQNQAGQWPLEKSYSADLVTRVETESPASRWATLNAVRVIVRLV